MINDGESIETLIKRGTQLSETLRLNFSNRGRYHRRLRKSDNQLLDS